MMNDLLNRTLYTNWADYIDNDGKSRTYKCRNCKNFGGKMKYRRVTERTGGEHKEYKIECEVCGHKNGVFWSKVLAESTWEAEHDPYWEGTKVVSRA
jgi:hypothetical protein